MDTFSEKELEQLKKLEQLRRLIQTILGAHLRLLIATFVIILIVILVSVYLAAVRSPVRYEARAMLYFNPKQTANIRPYNAKYVEQMLTRKELRTKFYKDLKIDLSDKRNAPNLIRVEPVELHRVLDRFRITVHAAKLQNTIDYTNAFALHCTQAYTDERIAGLQDWKNVLLQKKQDIFNEIERLDREKAKLGAPIQTITPEQDYEQMRQLLAAQRVTHTRLSLSVASLTHRSERLKEALSKINPALFACEKEIRTRLATLDQIDHEVLVAQELYTDQNPKLIALLARRKVLQDRYQAYLKEKQLTDDDVDSLDRAIALAEEQKLVDEDLRAKQEELQIISEELAETNDKFERITEVIPRMLQINQQYASLQESLEKLDASVADINYLMPLVKDDLMIGEYANSAIGLAPFSKRNLAICIFAAISITGFLATLVVLVEFWFGKVISEKELPLISGLRYLGSLPTSEKQFGSERRKRIGLGAICHNFRASEVDHHIVLAGALPGGKILPALFDTFEWTFAMAGKRTLTINVVLASGFDYESLPLSDTGIVIYSGSKGYLPVVNKRFLSPSELMLLKKDLQLLRETYDLIFIRHSVSLRRDRMFLDQFVGLCDGAMIAVGARRTSRSDLRRLAALNRRTKLPIMTIFSDNLMQNAEKDTNLEVGL